MQDADLSTSTHLNYFLNGNATVPTRFKMHNLCILQVLLLD